MSRVRYKAGIRSLAAALLATLAVAGSAQAVPAHVAPADGATVASTRPTFTWTWDSGPPPSGINSVLLHVSDRPTLDAEGALERTGTYREIYYGPNLDGSESTTTYTPPLATALPAGTYYWQVRELNTVLPTIHSAVWTFKVPAKALIRTLSGSATASGESVRLKVGFTANSERVSYRIEMWRGGKRRGVPETGFGDNNYTVGGPISVTEQFSPERLRMKAGERYTVKVRITASGVSHTRNLAMLVRR